MYVSLPCCIDDVIIASQVVRQRSFSLARTFLTRPENFALLLQDASTPSVKMRISMPYSLLFSVRRRFIGLWETLLDQDIAVVNTLVSAIEARLCSEQEHQLEQYQCYLGIGWFKLLLSMISLLMASR
jgi:hypothetical protein